MNHRILNVLCLIVLLTCLTEQVFAKININTATVQELQSLPQIGPGLAQAIVDYRDSHGPFKSTRDIMLVPRIGDKTYQRIQSLITVGDKEEVSKETSKERDNLGEQETNMPENISKNDKEKPQKLEENTSVREIMQIFQKEPSIREVQEAAIRYAEIDPMRYARWRENAKRKALIPEVFQITVGHDTDDDTDYDRSKTISLSGGTVTLGPDDETWKHSTDDDWDYEIKMKWNFQDYLFNSDMLRISSETQDQVDFRQDILNEITKLYFDRRRLIIDMKLNPAKDIQTKINRQIRLEEITAAIDALTNGYFSKNIQSSNMVGN